MEMEMGTNDTIQLIIIVILLVCGYAAMLQYVYKHTANRGVMPVLAVLLLGIYGGISAVVVMTLKNMGGWNMALTGTLVLGASIMLVLALGFLMKNFRVINKGWTAMLFVYILVVAYLTMFSRDGKNSTDIIVDFPSIREVIETRSLDPLNHMFLNVVMFVPIGFLLVMVDPEKLDRFALAVAVSAMLSVTIESVQLLLRLGQCDLEDIVANTLGGAVGVLLFRVYSRFLHRES